MQLTEIADAKAILSGTGQIQQKMVPGGMMMNLYFVKIYMSRENKKKVLLGSNYMWYL